MSKWYAASLVVVCLAVLAVGCGPTLQPEKTEPGAGAPSAQTFTIGDTVAIGNYKITVNKVRTSKGGEFIKPESGHVWFIVECALENAHATQPQAVSSLMMFDLVDKDGRSMDWAIFADTKGKLDGELGVGRKMTGEIGWEVPVGAEGLELVFTPDPFQKGQAIFSLGDL